MFISILVESFQIYAAKTNCVIYWSYLVSSLNISYIVSLKASLINHIENNDLFIIIYRFPDTNAKIMSLLQFLDQFQEHFLLYKLNFGWKVCVSHFIKLSLPSLLKSEPRNCMIILEKEPRQLNSKYLSFHLWLSWRQVLKDVVVGVQGIILTGQFD